MIEEIIVVPYLAAVALLIAAGVAKIRDPLPLRRTLQAARLVVSSRLAQTVGGVELAIGGAALVVDHPAVSAALATIYATFAVFVAALLVLRVPTDSCGCAGSRPTPPNVVHVVLNLIAAGCALTAVVVGTPTAVLVLDDMLLALPKIVATLTVASAAYLVAGNLPALARSYSPPSRA